MQIYKVLNNERDPVASGTMDEMNAVLNGDLPDGRYFLVGPLIAGSTYLRQNGTLRQVRDGMCFVEEAPGVLLGRIPSGPLVILDAKLVTPTPLRLIRQMAEEMRRTKTPWLLAITGYDDDPRELHEIPEVALFCQRLVDSGFISLLLPSTSIRQFSSEFGVTPLDGLGAFEVWSLAQGSFGRKSSVANSELARFWQAMSFAATKVELSN